MKIVHVLSYFKPDAAYQENLLTRGQFEIGNEVTIITSNKEPLFTSNVNDRNHSLGESNYHGVKVVRIKPLFEITNRFIIFRSLYKEIKKENPDLIFFHDHDPNIIICCIYKIFNKSTRLVTDVHSDHSNSMNSKIGPFYHKVYLRNLIRFTKRICDKVFCVSPEALRFANEVYKIDVSKLEILPLPGDSNLNKDYDQLRVEKRNELGANIDTKVLVHTGKLPEDKKTKEVLHAFSEIEDPNIRLLIAGSISDGFRQEFDTYVNNDLRITYLGWLKPIELREIFIASDLLVQPGSLSNTFIDAICSKLPLLLNDTPQGRYITTNNNGFLIKKVSVASIKDAIEYIVNSNKLKELKLSSDTKNSMFEYKNVAKKSLEFFDEN
jgi:1,2-diacylglycerol 3-alpha-glucosyltransferase